MAIAGTAARTGSGLVLGALSAGVHLVLALPLAAALLVPALRTPVEALGGRLAALEARRVTTMLGGATGSAAPPPARALRYLLARAPADGRLRAAIRDDGRGGADPAGGGLAGLARRVAAADGAFSVESPPGGPTVVTAELPCA